MARPKIEIDKDQLYKLASMGCTTEEIAAFFDCSRDTIERRFAAILAKGRQTTKIRLRRIQWQIAEKGSAAMGIFLGKNLLGQSDKIESEITEAPELKLSYNLDD